MSDLPWSQGEPAPATRNGSGPRRHRHRWFIDIVDGVSDIEGTTKIGVYRKRCLTCRAFRDEARARRGKNNRKRGGSLQLWFNGRLGLVNLPGSSGRETDGRSEDDQLAGNAMFVAQVKSGLRFPGWMQKILDGLPRSGGRVPILGIVQTPGPGHRRRAVVVMDLEDFVSLHGGTEQ